MDTLFNMLEKVTGKIVLAEKTEPVATSAFSADRKQGWDRSSKL